MPGTGVVGQLPAVGGLPRQHVVHRADLTQRVPLVPAAVASPQPGQAGGGLTQDLVGAVLGAVVREHALEQPAVRLRLLHGRRRERGGLAGDLERRPHQARHAGQHRLVGELGQRAGHGPAHDVVGARHDGLAVGVHRRTGAPRATGALGAGRATGRPGGAVRRAAGASGRGHLGLAFGQRPCRLPQHLGRTLVGEGPQDGRRCLVPGTQRVPERERRHERRARGERPAPLVRRDMAELTARGGVVLREQGDPPVRPGHDRLGAAGQPQRAERNGARPAP
jgi:hypothetical protein